MARKKQREDATRKLKQLAKLFTQEVAVRKWGRGEFDKLIADSKRAGEPVDAAEAKAVKSVLACIDRVTSIKVAAACAIAISKKAPGTAGIPPRLFGDLVGAIRVQAARAVRDASKAANAGGTRINRRFARALTDTLKATRQLRQAIVDVDRAVRAGIKTRKRLQAPAAVNVLRDIALISDQVSAFAAKQIKRATR